jgi:hypothetical protein
MTSETVTRPRPPNFLVIGLPKAGTTSVYFYLRQHPQVFMSPAKELEFFRFNGKQPQWNGPQRYTELHFNDLPSRGKLITPQTEPGIWWGATPSTWEEYLQFFAGVTTETAIGEATTSNFFSADACSNIQRLLPDVRLICILRQPVGRGFSQFQHARRISIEPLDDFVAAYRDCERRRHANWSPFLSLYETRGWYTHSLQAYRSRFSQEQLRIYLYDDLCTNPIAMMQDIYRFLGVDPAFIPDVSQKYNQSFLPRNRRVSEAIRGLNHGVKRLIKRLLPAQLHGAVSKLNRIRPHLNPAIRRQLTAEYANEICELQDLIGRDLSGWLGDQS